MDTTVFEAIKIYELRPADVPSVARLYRDTWREAYVGIVPDAYLQMLQPDGWVAYFDALLQQADPARQAVTLFVIDRLAGAASIQKRTDDAFGPQCGELCSIYLFPEYWGRGYGQALLRDIERRFSEMGCRRYMLWVLKENHRARRAYERAGLKQTGAGEMLNIAGKPLEQICYLKTLT